MNFYVLNTLPAKLTDYKNCILLIRDNWDDWFQYQTQCYVKYVNENLTIMDIGEVKIGQFKMGNQRTASYPNEFKKLPENLFHWGKVKTIMKI